MPSTQKSKLFLRSLYFSHLLFLATRTMISSSLATILTVCFISRANAFVARPPPLATRTSRAFAASTTTSPGVAKDGTVLDLLDSNFESLFNSEKPLLIDAYATFCGPCKLIEPVIRNCAKNWADSLVVSRWNIEALQTDVKIELLLQGANPRSLPTLILVHQGKATQICSGLITEDQLDDLLSEYLPFKTVELPEQPTKQSRDSERNVAEKSSKRKSGFINFGLDTADDYMLTMER
jgi:thioredoxin 1